MANNKFGTGYKCECGHRTEVLDSRTHELGFYRRRRCTSCGLRVTTIEVNIDVVGGKMNIPEEWDESQLTEKWRSKR